MFSSILIYGMGMMGASIGLALKSLPSFQGKIHGVVRSQKSARIIEDQKIADLAVTDAKELDLASYDLIVLGMQVQSIAALVPSLPETKSLITDISSTRRVVHNEFAKRPDLRFIGSHPMCGSEDAGPQAARPELFKKRLCILFDSPSAGTDDLDRLDAFWKSLGMLTYRMQPDDHDAALAYLSHAPHMISGALALWALKNPSVAKSLLDSPMPITGGGFKDMARIAGSNPEMWSDILETNLENIAGALEKYSEDIALTAKMIRTGNRETWVQWFREARKARNKLSGYEEDR